MLNDHNIEEESSKRIRAGAIISYVAIVINILAGLLFTPWMISQIGQNNYGLYTLASSIISVFTIDFGLSAAVSRFVAKFHAENNQKSINQMLSITYRLYLLIDVIILAALIIVYLNIELIYQELTVVELQRFKVVFAIAALHSVISFPAITFNGILSAYENFVELKLADLLRKVLSVLLITMALLGGLGLYALVASNAIAGITAITYQFYIIRNRTEISIDLTHKNSALTKEIFGFSTWSAIIGISQRLIFNITPSILGAVAGAGNIAIFGVASTLEGYVFIIADALNGLFLPKVNRILNKENASNNILNLMIKVGRIQLMIVGLIVIGFISIGRDFILLWLNEDYLMSYFSVILLILPGLVHLTQQIGYTSIIAMNKVRYQAKISIVVSICNVMLSILFSSQIGALGASLAIFISYMFQMIGENFIFKKYLELDIFRFFKECHLKMLIPQGIVLFISLSLSFLPLELSWSNLLIKGLIIVSIYILIMWTFVMNDFEKNVVKSVLER